VDRFAAYRGLLALEQAGVIRVERHRGRLALVHILDVEYPRAEQNEARRQLDEVIGAGGDVLRDSAAAAAATPPEALVGP
jgi:hypothetical protein